MPTTLEVKTPRLVTALPGPNAKRVLEQDANSCRRPIRATILWWLSADTPRSWKMWTVTLFWISPRASPSARPDICHPKVVAAIQKQAAELDSHVRHGFLLRKHAAARGTLGQDHAGAESKKVFFNQFRATEAIEGAIKLARYATRRDKFIAFYGCFHGRSMGALSLTASKSTQRKWIRRAAQ